MLHCIAVIAYHFSKSPESLVQDFTEATGRTSDIAAPPWDLKLLARRLDLQHPSAKCVQWITMASYKTKRRSSVASTQFTSRRKFRSQTSDNMDRWKSRGGKSQGGEEKKWEDQRRGRERRKKMQVREKVGKSRFTVFPMICGSGGSKSRLAKAAVAEPAGQMRDEQLHAVVARRCAKHMSKSKCIKHLTFGPLLEVEMSKKRTPLWCKARFQVKMLKTHQRRTTFGSWDVEKKHAVVARSRFPSQNAKSTPTSDPLLEVETSKKSTPLWREVDFQVIVLKAHQRRTHFWKLRRRKRARRCGAK